MSSELEKTAEKKECLFCELGKNPKKFIFENVLYYSQLDKFPISPGHTEVIPKKHILSLLDLNYEEWASLRKAIQGTVNRLESLDFKDIYTDFLANPVNEKSVWFSLKMLEHPGIGKKPDGYNYGVNDGAAAGRTVHHLHLHIIPRFNGDVEDPRGGVRHIIPGMGNYK